MTDLEKVISEWCTAASTLQTEISGRMWTPIAPKDFKNTGAAIVYHKQSSKTHTSGAIHSPVYVFKCYGGTEKAGAARNVGRLLFDRLFGADGSTASGQMITAEVVGGGGIMKEPETGFWADVSIYQILIAG